MKLHEYQAKALLHAAGVTLPRGAVAKTPNEVRSVFALLGSCEVVVKAQVHAGGRGKAGGIQKVSSADSAVSAAEKLLGSRLITIQTTSLGQPVSAVYLEAMTTYVEEYYLALLLDRSRCKMVIMFSKAGGMDIEEVAQKHPEALVKCYVPMAERLPSYVARLVASCAGQPIEGAMHKLLGQLYQLYIERDVTLLEVNPLVRTAENTLIPLDAKIIIDDNAAFRQVEIAHNIDESQDEPTEVEARRIGLSYIPLSGNIGCMVNGAGLAMATMDLIQVHGGEPANFLDVGGGANAEQIRQAFCLILKDRRVKSVLVNIFGGIMRCDVIAQGIVDAAATLHITVPVVVRLEGTNVEKGKSILAQSQLKLVSAATLEEAAKMAVHLAKDSK